MNKVKGKPTPKKQNVDRSLKLSWFPSITQVTLDKDGEVESKCISIAEYCCLTDEEFKALQVKASMVKYATRGKTIGVPARTHAYQTEDRKSKGEKVKWIGLGLVMDPVYEGDDAIWHVPKKQVDGEVKIPPRLKDLNPFGNKLSAVSNVDYYQSIENNNDTTETGTGISSKEEEAHTK